MTRLSRDGAAAFQGEVPRISYTTCDHCNAAVCCDCWALILDAVAAFFEEHPDYSVVPDDVWHTLLSRAWQGCSTAGRPRGFTPRDGGGGTWHGKCPLCVDQLLPEAAEPPPPPTFLLSGSTRAQQRLTAGPQYALATPEPLLDVRMLIPARPLCDDGSDGPVLMHSIRVIKYAQLVANDDARAAFRYVPHLI
jgi:hypothetical protein